MNPNPSVAPPTPYQWKRHVASDFIHKCILNDSCPLLQDNEFKAQVIKSRKTRAAAASGAYSSSSSSSSSSPSISPVHVPIEFVDPSNNSTIDVTPEMAYKINQLMSMGPNTLGRQSIKLAADFYSIQLEIKKQKK
jgi:hypothetical protein